MSLHSLQRALLVVLLATPWFAANPVIAETREYDLTIAWDEVDFTGRAAAAMTVNGGIPGPTLRFTEGDLARIHVHNEMDVDTSIHWHGILVPPGMDGVPYISFPPIAAGSTFTYEFPIRQSGTYWYHSHTELQEQRGVYGSIVILPREGLPEAADRDHVVLLSDWTDTDPRKVLRTLRRGSEWFAVQRGTGQSIFGAARSGKLRDYFERELQRMPAMDIADVAYDRFLANGQVSSSLPSASGETVRLRLIDGSATTFFHVEFAGGPLTVVSADGVDVEPFTLDRLLIGVAETYDVIVRVPADGSYELRATAHDASGHASVWLGQGTRHHAPDVPYPDLYRSMGGLDAGRVFALTPAGAMGMPDREVDAGAFDEPGMNMTMDHGAMDHGAMDHGAMDDGSMAGGQMDHATMGHDSPGAMEHGGTDHEATGQGDADRDHAGHGASVTDRADPEPMDHARMDHSRMDHDVDGEPTDHAATSDAGRSARGHGRSFGWLATDLSARGELVADGMDPARPWPPYDRLRARRATAFDPDLPVREIRLTLDGDMERYVWFLNETPLSASDEIEIKEGEVARFIMINRTMMHHPMHLHGHFFRVVNAQGEHAPLKHTVNVEPMSTTVIEFEADEVGDWFFHCHLLYHMKSGMARVVSYADFVPPADVRAVRSKLYQEHWYAWGDVDLMSHMHLGSLVTANTLNMVSASWEIGWQGSDETETEITLAWDRYVNRFATWFVGIDAEAVEDRFDDPRGVLGFGYLLPLNVESRFWIDSDGEARGMLEKAFHLTPRWMLTLETEYDTLEDWEGAGRVSYTVGQNLDVLGQWHSEYGWGAGIALRF